MALVFYLLAVGIDKVELHSAELSTLATVGTTVETILRSIAQARIANAQCSMNKHLELQFWVGIMDGANFLRRQFARQHHSLHAMVAKPKRLLLGASVALGRSMQRYDATTKFCQSHILHQQGVYTYGCKLTHESHSVVEFVFVDDGVYRYVYLCSILMCMKA